MGVAAADVSSDIVLNADVGSGSGHLTVVGSRDVILAGRADLLTSSTAPGGGQVYVEAMAMGLPVIACRAAAPPTYIDDDPASPHRCGWRQRPS